MSVSVIIYMIFFSFPRFSTYFVAGIYGFTLNDVLITEQYQLLLFHIEPLYIYTIVGLRKDTVCQLLPIYIVYLFFHLQIISCPLLKSKQDIKHSKTPMMMLCRCKHYVHQKLSNLSFSTYPHIICISIP